MQYYKFRHDIYYKSRAINCELSCTMNLQKLDKKNF